MVIPSIKRTINGPTIIKWLYQPELLNNVERKKIQMFHDPNTWIITDDGKMNDSDRKR